MCSECPLGASDGTPKPTVIGRNSRATCPLPRSRGFMRVPKGLAGAKTS